VSNSPTVWLIWYSWCIEGPTRKLSSRNSAQVKHDYF
jgi:hypothetical protein